MEELDIHDANKAFLMSINLNKYALEYKEALETSANAKQKFDIFMASKLEEITGTRKTLGYESAQILLLSRFPIETTIIYNDYVFFKARASGLEKVIDALQTQISLYQSICKNLPR